MAASTFSFSSLSAFCLSHRRSSMLKQRPKEQDPPQRGNIIDNSNGDFADDHYHRYKEDVELIHDLGVDSYRFSISWSRILPRGRHGEINPIGIRFYKDLIDALVLKGIQLFVTLHHYDIPQELQDRYGGWLSREMIEEFTYFAEVCFKEFGEKVKYWTTFNEPNTVIKNGYSVGEYPPSRCSEPFGHCRYGDSYREPYIAAHNIILSHASAVHLYKTKYKGSQGGAIGIVMSAMWYEPISDAIVDQDASEQVRSFHIEWFLDPATCGNYPLRMRKILGSRLPKFSTQEKKLLQESKSDFIGLNHYSSYYAADCNQSSVSFNSFCGDALVCCNVTKDGVFIGPPTGMPREFFYPDGMEKIVMYITQRYKNVPIFISENGFGTNSSTSNMSDQQRIEFISGYLTSLSNAMRKGADVRGYFAWTLMDNFEWVYGYDVQYGFYHVNFTTQERTPRLSAKWYKEFINGPKILEMAELNSTGESTNK